MFCLVDAPDHIVMLVACKVIPLTLGLRAARELPPNTSEYDQLGWLADAVENPVPPRHRSRMREITGKDVRIVETARTVAKVLVGFSASVVEIDRFVIDCFVQKLTEAEILERAKAVPPRPVRLDKPPPRSGRGSPSLRSSGNGSPLGIRTTAAQLALRAPGSRSGG